MDDLDLSIYRWMYPDGVWSYWGIDPRITTAEIAQHLGLRRKAVWARIRQWRQSGLWQDPTVRPNPRLFGLNQFQAELPVADASQGWALVEELGLVGRVLVSNVAFTTTETGRNEEVVQLRFAADDRTDLDRVVRLLKRISPTGTVYGPYRDIPPRCTRELSPLDWRILAALVADPGASLTQVAHFVGVTLKTVARRRSALIDSHAIWYLPNIDWSRHPSVCFTLFCNDPRDMDRVRAALDARFPHHLPMSTAGFGFVRPIYGSRPLMVVRVPAHSPGESQKLEVELARLSGVKMVRPTIWGPFRWFPHWADPLIAAHLLSKGKKDSVTAASRRALTPGRRTRLSPKGSSSGRSRPGPRPSRNR